MIYLQPLGNRGRLVVVAPKERVAALIADPRSLGRVVGQVVGRAALARQPAAQPRDGDLIRQINNNDKINVSQPVEKILLNLIARVAVEDESLRAVGPANPILDYLVSQLIRYELAGAKVGSHLSAERRLVLQVVTKNIARGNVGHVVPSRDILRLGSFARTLRSEDNDVHTCSSPASWSRLRRSMSEIFPSSRSSRSTRLSSSALTPLSSSSGRSASKTAARCDSLRLLTRKSAACSCWLVVKIFFGLFILV